MKTVTVYSLGLSQKTAELDFVEFHRHAPLMRGDPEQWHLVGEQTYVRHREPVQQIAMPNGQRVYLAMEPDLRDLLVFACEEQLRAKVLEQQREVERLLAQGKDLEHRLERERLDAVEWRSRWEQLLDTIADASPWQRLKYLFTRRI